MPHVTTVSHAGQCEGGLTIDSRRGNRQIWLAQQLLLDENYDKRGKLDGEYTIWRNKKAARG